MCFKKHKIMSYSVNGESWFKGKDKATILDYNDTDKAKSKLHVKKIRKINRDSMTRCVGGAYLYRKTIYINEAGLLSLICGQ